MCNVIFRRTHIDAFFSVPSVKHTNERCLTMVDLFGCAGARPVPEAGNEVLSQRSASGHEALTRVFVAGDEVLTKGWRTADSASAPLSARMVAGLADFILSGVQHPNAGYSPVHEYLTAGITHPEKANPSRGCNSASRSSGRRVRTSVSQACGSRPLRFAVSRRLIICAARFPAISEPANSHTVRPITTVRMARSQILLSRGTTPSLRKQLSSSRRFRI